VIVATRQSRGCRRCYLLIRARHLCLRGGDCDACAMGWWVRWACCHRFAIDVELVIEASVGECDVGQVLLASDNKVWKGTGSNIRYVTPISTMKKFLRVFWTEERASSGVP
jgi:hypothetical protein